MGDRGARRFQRWLLVTAIVGAVLPIVVAGVRAALDGWVATWDHAYPALRAADVFSRHPPLLGTRSGGASMTHEANHPGPLEFIALSPWVQLFGRSAGTALGVAATNTMCVLAVTWLSFRRGGYRVATIATATFASLAWSMGSQLLFDPWGPYATVLPFGLLVIAGWSVADGDLVALPVLTVSASFVLQTYLGYSTLAPAIVLTSLIMLAWRLIIEWGRSKDWSTTRACLLRWGPIGLGAGIVCWIPPLYEQLSRPGGNLTALIDSSGSRSNEWVSFGSAIRLFAATVALPPWWLPPSMSRPAIDRVGRGLSPSGAFIILALLGALMVVAALRARRRGNAALAVGLWYALVISPWVVATVAYGSGTVGLFDVPHVKFMWVFAALVVMWLALALIEELRHLPAIATVPILRGRRRQVATAVPAAAAMLFGLLAIPAVDRTETTLDWSIEVTRQLAADVIPAVEGKGPVLVVLTNPFGASSVVGPGLMVEMSEAGVDFMVRDRDLISQLGNHRAFNRGLVSTQLIIAGPTSRPPSPTARLIAESPGRTAAEDRELASLRGELRDALERSGGLPLRTDYSKPQSAELTALLRQAIDGIKAVDDPAELLASEKLIAFVAAAILLYRTVDELVDSDAFPTRDLERYVNLTIQPDIRAVQVYIDGPPRR